MSVEHSPLQSDRTRAETLLFELARDLRLVPVGDKTRSLHLRALQLKAAVLLWSDEGPDGAARTTICDEIVDLQRQARDLRHLRSGGQLLRAELAREGQSIDREQRSRSLTERDAGG